MLKAYYPEMSEPKPEADFEARMSHGGDHWYIDTPLTLKGRGIAHRGTLQSSHLVPEAQHKTGWNQYRVTEAAFRRLAEQYDISTPCML
jgi:hypothetical protein